MGMKSVSENRIGKQYGAWVVLCKEDGEHFTCKCSNCGKVKTVTRVCLIRNKQLGATGCRNCRCGRGVKRKSVGDRLQCTACLRLLPMSEFHTRSKNTTHKKDSYCRECKRDKKLRWDYNISSAQYNNLAAKVKFQCCICERKLKLVVDHNHKTGLVRGLLCPTCNSGLGFFKEDIIMLQRAIQYLQEGNIETSLQKLCTKET